jgi:hypothetical protein
MKGQQRGGRRAESTAVLTVVCAALLLAACSREAGDWRTTQGADTIEAYERFIEQYPQSEFAAQARERTRQLAEERDWQAATSADTAEAYQQFLSQYPEGKWTQEARVRIENFNVMEGAATAPAPAVAAMPTPAPAPAAAAAAAAAAPAAAAAAPAPPAAAPATAAAAPAGRYRVQLGAFSSEAKAREAWQAASGRFAALRPLAPLVSATSRGDSRLYRLQTALSSEAEARELCRSLQAGGQACLYVPPR